MAAKRNGAAVIPKWLRISGADPSGRAVAMTASFAVAAAALQALAQGSDSGRHEPVLEVPPGWALRGFADSEAMITLHFALRPRRPAASLTAFATMVSDPSHPRFGHYLDLRGLAELVESTPRCIGSVRAWATETAAHHGNDTASAAGGRVAGAGEWPKRTAER